MPDPIVDLEKLVELQDKGFLTTKEFEVKRRQVLGLRTRGRLGRALLRLLILLSVCAGGFVAGRSFQRFLIEEHFITAPAEALDANQMVGCDNGGALYGAVRQVKGARVHLASPHETFADPLLRARRCEADLSIEAKPAGVLIYWIVMRNKDRYEVTPVATRR